MRRLVAVLAICMVTSLLPSPEPVSSQEHRSGAGSSPIESDHLRRIQELFSQNGLRGAKVGIDDSGRVILKGAYQDRKEVDTAFSLAQTVVGVRWVSPVVPENIKVKEWEKAFSRLFPIAGNKPRSLETESPPAGRVAEKYALIVGVGKFREKVNRLKYAAKDASDFYSYLTNPNIGNFRRENVTLLINEKATRANILTALDDIKAKAGPDDLVLLYFSSHGTPPNIYGSVNIVTYDTVAKPRPAIWHSSITDETLSDFIQGIKTKRLLVILDTCYSSGAYKQVEGFLPTGGKSLGIEDEGYGMSQHMAKRLLGAKDLVLAEEPSDSGSESSAQDGWGRVLISASGPEEQSFESEKLKNSFFTYHFLRGLKKFGNVKQAFEYATPRVTADVMEEKQQPQHPQAVADRKNWNIIIPR